MTKLEKIVKEAQKMRKAHPKKYAKWTDYIKAASKSIAGYVGTKKTATTTTVNYTRKVAVKKTKPSTQAKLFGNKTHKDTKSHNVNIRVVSGAKHDNVDVIIKKIANNKIKLAESRKAAKAEKDPYMKLLITAHRVNKYRDEIKLLQLELKQIQSKIRKSK